ncbi:uncharacterized protein LOC124419277 [Lucilia cuprina]|uniref:uncharacterized protein LOC124419277 n=1 Tax=Lucilia cuprina TaxID=7375 RepID=UPI001F06F671|nr:uncharacterized protein LOC124419277 [Lucilia cuprina]
MLNFQLFIIIGANVAIATATNINLKLLTTLTRTNTTTVTTSETKGNISSKHNIDDEAFVQFLKYVSQEQSFTTIVILTNWQYATTSKTAATTTTWKQNDYCVNLKYYMEYDQHHLENHKMLQQQEQTLVPVILLQSQQTEYRLHKKFNSEFVTIICIPPSPLPLTLSLPQQRQVITKVTQNHLLRALSKNLLYLRKNRVILRLDFNQHEGENLQNIVEILKYCSMEQIINIMIISYQFPYNDTVYYSYEKFPRFKITKNNWLKENFKQQKLFPNQLQNLKGYKIFTLPDQIEPRSMVYNDSQGHQQICGYVGNFVRYFAQGLNASLVLAYEVAKGVQIFYSDILKLTRNHTLDIPASLTGPINGTDWSEFSYPFEIADWCVMLPVEPEISMADIFLAVLNPYFIINLLLLFICCTFLLLIVFKRISIDNFRLHLSDILINDKAFRAILGQGFPFNNQNLDYFVVYVFILIFFTGLVVIILFDVFLGSFMTSPPKNPPIRSFADLEKSGIKLYISKSEYAYIYPSDYLKHPQLFHIIDSFNEFVRLRNTLNTSRAYVITSSSWPVFAVQQQLFSRPLFRYSKDLCFSRYLHFYFILPMHSVFREALQMSTLRAYSLGLFFHWFESSFNELVSLGHLSFDDITEPRKLMPISVEDLKLIFMGFYILLLVSVGIFVLELFFDHINIFFNLIPIGAPSNPLSPDDSQSVN